MTKKNEIKLKIWTSRGGSAEYTNKNISNDALLKIFKFAEETCKEDYDG
jgi:hypothetical protein